MTSKARSGVNSPVLEDYGGYIGRGGRGGTGFGRRRCQVTGLEGNKCSERTGREKKEERGKIRQKVSLVLVQSVFPTCAKRNKQKPNDELQVSASHNLEKRNLRADE